MTRQRYSPDPMFYTVPIAERKRVHVPEQIVERIYDAAYAGLRGEKLAYASGFTPEEFAFLTAANKLVALAIKQGAADNERDVAAALMENALNGDTKAAVVVLTHRHDWMPAKPEGDPNNQQLTITVVNAEPAPKTTHTEPTGETISLIDPDV